MISRERHSSYYTSKRDKIYCACASFIHGNASSVTCISVKLPLTHLVNKFLCFLPPNASDRANFLIVEENTVKLVCGSKHLRSEGCCDELCSRREVMDHGYVDKFSNRWREGHGETHRQLRSGIERRGSRRSIIETELCGDMEHGGTHTSSNK